MPGPAWCSRAGAAAVKLQLPVIYCRGCATQLAWGICVVPRTGALICVFCAGDMARAGRGLEVRPVYPPAGWGGMGFAEPLDPVEGAALLLRGGAAVVMEMED